MNALRLKLYQQTACYKKPFAFKVSETYPLPPYSTVKGMLHSIMDASSLIPMKISIQGQYDTISTDYQTHYFFKKDQTNEFALTIDGLGVELEMKEVTTMPIYMHMLYDVMLIIHVLAEEKILRDLERRISSGTTHLSLGRWEDLVRVDECEIVEIHPCHDEPLIKYNAYVPMNILTDENHFVYKLNWTYRIVKGVRVWDKIPVGYVLSGEPIGNFEEIMNDSYGDLIFFP
jgi:CRISPR-associated protein Cas5t